MDHPTLSEAAVLAFEVLSLEDPQLHLPQIKHLFKQKIFVYLLKKLESKIEKLSESHMSALIFVMKITPHVVLKMNIEKLKPVLLKSLNLTQPKALIATLNIIKRFLDEKEECFNNLIPSLVQQLLKLTQFKTSMVSQSHARSREIMPNIFCFGFIFTECANICIGMSK